VTVKKVCLTPNNFAGTGWTVKADLSIVFSVAQQLPNNMGATPQIKLYVPGGFSMNTEAYFTTNP
jgi:hypothetical protein